MARIFVSCTRYGEPFLDQLTQLVGEDHEIEHVAISTRDEVSRKGELRSRAWLRQHMKDADVVVYLSDPRPERGRWVDWELSIATALGCPIVAVAAPTGAAAELPASLTRATPVHRWRDAPTALVAALQIERVRLTLV